MACWVWQQHGRQIQTAHLTAQPEAERWCRIPRCACIPGRNGTLYIYLCTASAPKQGLRGVRQCLRCPMRPQVRPDHPPGSALGPRTKNQESDQRLTDENENPGSWRRRAFVSRRPAPSAGLDLGKPGDPCLLQGIPNLLFVSQRLLKSGENVGLWEGRLFSGPGF